MNSQRVFYTLLILIVLLAAGILGGAYATNKLLLQQSSRLVDNRLQVATLNQEQIQLSKAKNDIKKYESLASIAQAVVPQDKDQAQTVREIVNIASNYGIAIGSITFPTSMLGSTAAGTATVPAGKLALSQLIPVKGIAGVYDLQITVQNDPNTSVSYTSFINFLNGLEQNRRTALISGINIQPDVKTPSNVSFTLILDEYIKP